MQINVGSKNPVKVQALEEILSDYPDFKGAELTIVETPSGVSDQPKSLDETVQGAMNRAKNSFSNCQYSFGMESGLMAVPNTKSGYMDVCVCAIFDGEEYHLGLSSAWEAPKKVTEMMLREGLDMNDAAYRSGFTDNLKVGSAEGLVGIMTKGRLTRKEYTKEAIRTALIHVEK
ncbi:MAG: inosine/xanthosine triphosphatase [Patescibacteria group bacterium]